MLKFLVILLITLLPAISSAQKTKVTDLSKADSLAMFVKYEGDIFRLTKQLTDPFTDQTLKARAIFRWITDNIEYDCKYYNKYAYKGKDPKTYTCGDDDRECNIRRQVWENEYISTVLNKRKAVCQGYAMLFKKMCSIAGIESEIVPGYVRTEYYEVGTAGALDHAWNIVRLNTRYYLLDATWAAGGCSKDDDGRLVKFQKHFENYYWLTPPGDFLKNHYPEDPKWVLMAKYTKENFSANPYYAPEVVSKIKLLAPGSGIVSAKRGDTLKFKIIYTDQIHNLQINSNVFQNPDTWMWKYINKHETVKVPDTLAIKQQQYIKYKQSGEIYEFAYVVKDNSLEYLDILFDEQRVMRFNTKVRR